MKIAKLLIFQNEFNILPNGSTGTGLNWALNLNRFYFDLG